MVEFRVVLHLSGGQGEVLFGVVGVHVVAEDADVHAEQVESVGGVGGVVPVQELYLSAGGRSRTPHQVALGLARRNLVLPAVAVQDAQTVVAHAVHGATLLTPLPANRGALNTHIFNRELRMKSKCVKGVINYLNCINKLIK